MLRRTHVRTLERHALLRLTQGSLELYRYDDELHGQDTCELSGIDTPTGDCEKVVMEILQISETVCSCIWDRDELDELEDAMGLMDTARTYPLDPVPGTSMKHLFRAVSSLRALGWRQRFLEHKIKRAQQRFPAIGQFGDALLAQDNALGAELENRIRSYGPSALDEYARAWMLSLEPEYWNALVAYDAYEPEHSYSKCVLRKVWIEQVRNGVPRNQRLAIMSRVVGNWIVGDLADLVRSSNNADWAVQEHQEAVAKVRKVAEIFGRLEDELESRPYLETLVAVRNTEADPSNSALGYLARMSFGVRSEAGFTLLRAPQDVAALLCDEVASTAAPLPYDERFIETVIGIWDPDSDSVLNSPAAAAQAAAML